MKKNVSKLRPTEQQTTEQQEQTQSQAAREFMSPEEMLRFDAAQTTPPASVTDRLRQSLAAEPFPKRPWWRRWFFGE